MIGFASLDRCIAIDARMLRLPLVRPYALSFGPIEAFDTLLVRATLDDGTCGFGEATVLPGYTDETVDGTWSGACALLAQARDGRAAFEQALVRIDPSHPFLVTAFRTALEMADAPPSLMPDRPARIEILGLLQDDGGPASLNATVQSLLDAGYRTLKIKVGFDAAQDAARVADAQRAVAGRATLRLDANQGYTSAQARDFVTRLDPAGIELFEQPCPADDWDAHMQVVPVARDAGIALMLDESIYSEREIERAAELAAADYIKVKLMKLRTLSALQSAIRRIRALGMKPVLGNGVANELGCWMEACVAAAEIDNAGEMNGFLKPRQRMFTQPLPFRGGAIELPAGWRPEIDLDALAPHVTATTSASLR